MIRMLLVNTVQTLFTIFFWLILARVILSWIQPQSYNGWLRDIMQVVFTLTEPILQPIRRVMPDTMGLDFSPIIALILLELVQGLIVQILL